MSLIREYDNMLFEGWDAVKVQYPKIWQALAAHRRKGQEIAGLRTDNNTGRIRVDLVGDKQQTLTFDKGFKLINMKINEADLTGLTASGLARAWARKIDRYMYKNPVNFDDAFAAVRAPEADKVEIETVYKSLISEAENGGDEKDDAKKAKKDPNEKTNTQYGTTSDKGKARDVVYGTRRSDVVEGISEQKN